ncbi:MAG: shikimate kinase [Chitinophagales bacterium]|nr:shikimate kinase [Sphingobacteriales bacterium]MBP9141860.1 shikimate kinase [Chitinophagales bacterium]MDA0199856.1 shikimate kinase [Bacteroidota bacterium]MBK6889478.1 shikimate kinase [Sphingobacteriales bacterium]MBK8679643.1 shikimate kinase [Sphingobacteriales bacterium]
MPSTWSLKPNKNDVLVMFLVQKPIFLIGYMGCGKTKSGKKLAQLLHTQFIDSDVQISNKENLSIPEIFARHGEAYFRILEHNWLQNFGHSRTPLVIAAGGGMPCFNDNIALMNKIGLTVYLQASVNLLVKRLATPKAQQKRPLIAHLKTPLVLAAHIASQLTEREPYYLQAQIVLPVDHLPAGQIETTIFSSLNTYLHT